MIVEPEGLEPVDILIVDDRETNVTSLEAALRRPDYNIVIARSGTEALAQVLRRDFAVILLDVAMPGMDGFETAKIIKEREQSKLVPIIFVTASVYDMEHVFRGYTVGAVDYLRKPADAYQVRAKVSVFVELFRQRKQIERQSIRLREAEVREHRILRERAEVALRQSESLYEHTFEEAPIGIGHATQEGAWVRANQKLCELVGHGRDDIVGRSIADIVEGDAARRLVVALARLKEGHSSVHSEEYQLSSTTGAECWGRVTISAIRESGSPARLLVVVQETTERKKVDRERARIIDRLEASIRVRDDFLALAAHELKTPLTPLKLQTASLIREGEKTGRRDSSFGRILARLKKVDAAASRLEEFVDRLLDFSRLSVGELELELEEVDLRHIAERAIARVTEQARLAGSELSLRAPGPVVGTWDRLRIEQVLGNLLSNALKYGGGQPVEVALTAEDDHVRLAVKDRGMGIPAAEQQRIFERFDRLGPVRHHGGFGIGLWIVREIVEAHGGHVTVTSAPGEGSEFVVELPRRKAKDKAA